MTKRTVYVYRYFDNADQPLGHAYTLTYLTPQTKGACIHEVEAPDGPTAKKLAHAEHRDKCGNRATAR